MTKETTIIPTDLRDPGGGLVASLLAAPSRRVERWVMVLGLAALAMAGFASSFMHVWDSDVHAHLACGEWMFRHAQVMGQDYFSIDPEPKWVNVHWGFQLLLTGLFKLGGYGALSYFKGVAAALIVLSLVLSLRREVPAGWLVFCGMLALYVMVSRIRERPETLTLLYIALSLAICDSVRRGASPNRLWWMVPLMLLWVNMHGLFFLGLVIMWTLAGGALADRYLNRWTQGRLRWLSRGDTSGQLPTLAALAPMIAATVICFVTPWPIETFTHPILLSTRMTDDAYRFGVSELAPVWDTRKSWSENWGPEGNLRFHHEAILLLVLTAGAIIANQRRLPLGHVLLLAFFTALALGARRNVGLLGPIGGFMLALHGGAALREVAAWKPALARAGPYFAGLMTLAAVGLAVAYQTGTMAHWHGHGALAGAGLQAEGFHLGSAKHLGQLPVEGDVLCENFGDAGPFLYYSQHDRDTPNRLMYMDGRLEAHSFERFKEIGKIRSLLGVSVSAGRVNVCKLPPSVRFVVVRYDSKGRLTTLMNARVAPPSTPTSTRDGRRFRLLYVDDAGACFERTDWHAGLPGKTDRVELTDEANFAELDRPLGPDGLLVGVPREGRTWYRRNPPAVDWQLGATLLALGQQYSDAPSNSATYQQKQCTLLAIRYLTAASNRRVNSYSQCAGALAQAYGHRHWQLHREPSAATPIDVNAARAQFLFRSFRLSSLSWGDWRPYTLQWIICMSQANMVDEAATSMAGFRKIVKEPSTQYLDMAKRVRKNAAASRKAAKDDRLKNLRPLERAAALASPKYGLINEAIAVLEKAPNRTADMNLLLGDLRLRKGLAAKACDAYNQAPLPPERRWELALRRALCDWVEGDLHGAAGKLRQLLRQHPSPTVKYYLVELCDQIGDTQTADLHRPDLRDLGKED